jgi:hypothetical protein
VLAGCGGIDRDLGVEAIWRGDGDQLDLGIAQQLAIVGVDLGDAVAFGKIGRMAFGRGSHSNELSFLGDRLHGAGNAVGLKAGADDTNFDFGHALF